MCPESSKKPPRAPITVEMLLYLHTDLDLNDPLDACIEFAATSAFWGQIRLGKILSTTQNEWDPELIPSHTDMQPPHTNAGSRILHLPNTKVVGRKGENVSLCHQFGPTDHSHTCQSGSFKLSTLLLPYLPKYLLCPHKTEIPCTL